MKISTNFGISQQWRPDAFSIQFYIFLGIYLIFVDISFFLSPAKNKQFVSSRRCLYINENTDNKIKIMALPFSFF